MMPLPKMHGTPGDCEFCRSEVTRLEPALSDFRGVIREWTGRMRLSAFRTSIPMDTGAGRRPDRLLMPASIELRSYQSHVLSVVSSNQPHRLLPLELISKPVDPSELKGPSGLYTGNETRAGLGSLAIHGAIIALLLALGSLKPVQKGV